MSVNRMSVDGGPFGVSLHWMAHGIRRNRVALLLALALNLADVLTTHLGLARGIPEGNPIPAMLHAGGGEVAMFAAKFAVMASAILLVSLLGRRYPRLWHTFTVTNLVLLAAVLSNSAQVLAP